MRVLNDTPPPRSSPERPEPLAVVAYTGLATLGFVGATSALTVLFAPLPFLMAHLRLPEPWPKVAGLAGAVLAVLGWEIPVGLAVVFFVAAIAFGDGVREGRGFWAIALRSVALSLAAAGLLLLAESHRMGMTPGAYWNGAVDRVLTLYDGIPQMTGMIGKEAFRSLLLYEAPFLMGAGVLICLWVSLGLAAHLRWIPDDHPLSAGGLRGMARPAAVTAGFAALFVARLWLPEPWSHVAEGAVLMTSVALFIQGCLVVSGFMARRNVAPPARTLLWCGAVTVGSYALLGLGAISPWLPERNTELEAKA